MRLSPDLIAAPRGALESGLFAPSIGRQGPDHGVLLRSATTFCLDTLCLLPRIRPFEPRRRAATPGERSGVLWHASGVAQRFAQQHLHLGVDAAELVVGPAHERIVDRRVDPQQDLSALAHVYSEPVLTTGEGG